jgi:hypothetical protein
MSRNIFCPCHKNGSYRFVLYILCYPWTSKYLENFGEGLQKSGMEFMHAKLITSLLPRDFEPGLPDFSRHNIPKWEKM